jgi:hypothetical protein
MVGRNGREGIGIIEREEKEHDLHNDKKAEI